MTKGFRLPSSTVALLLATMAVAVMGCATIPGKTGADQRATIDQLVDRTLADLYRQHPDAREEISSSVGYVIMNNKITKIPVFGGGAGYGAAVDRKTGERIYLRMTRFDIGAGWGARSVRPVLVFHDEPRFQRFVSGTFQATMGAEASAKVGDAGAAGGTGGRGKENSKEGYSAYLITDAGVSATWSVGFIRVKPVRLKE